VTALLELGADVEWTDADAAAAAREHAKPGAGRLSELVEWLAATQGQFPPSAPNRVRCRVIGAIDQRVVALAAELDVGLQALDVPTDPASAFTAGAAAADDEVDSGSDLVVLAAHDPSAAAGVVVGLLTGAEPVALLPRGAEAVDTEAWIERAGQLRDVRRKVAALRTRPDQMLAALDSPALAAAAGFALSAAARRTPVVLDGATAVAAALLCSESQSRAVRWWRIADTSPDPVHARAIEQLAQRPLLDLGTTSGNGTAGLLAVTILRAAARQA
jgi:nicotinate-nucleotide--dimethylbenzimidazole phosphoribosyltransferase